MPKIHLIGAISIEGPNGTLSEGDLEGRQGRLLMAFLLASRGQPATLDHLAEVLWPDRPLPPSWRKSLPAVLSKLRAALRRVGLPSIISEGRTGAFSATLPSEIWLDLDAAEEAVIIAQELLDHGDPGGASSEAAIARA